MRIAAEELLAVSKAALVGQGLPDDVASSAAAEAVDAELAGRKTHGVGKLVSLNFGDRNARPVITRLGSLIVVDGAGASGFSLMSTVADELIATTKHSGLAAAAVKNFSRYSSLRAYTERVAKAGFVGILMNSAGPAAVVPFGGIDPITGTNPISFSFPTSEGPHTLDMSTSSVVWGEIRQAAFESRPLASSDFLDSAGNVTADPATVNAVRAFGGAKGWAINLAIELLCGPVIGAKAGLAVQSEFDLGAFFLALDPARLGGEDYEGGLQLLFDDIRSSRPSGAEPVRVPGDRKSADIATEVDIPDGVLEALREMSAGRSTTELASNPLFN